MQFKLLCIRVTIVSSHLVPEEVSFYEPETVSCVEQMALDNTVLLIGNGSTELHASTPEPCRETHSSEGHHPDTSGTPPLRKP